MRWIWISIFILWATFAQAQGTGAGNLDLSPHLEFKAAQDVELGKKDVPIEKKQSEPNKVRDELKFPENPQDSPTTVAAPAQKDEESPFRKEMNVSPENMNIFRGKGTAVTPVGGGTD
jgi:hypothetical protein